MNRQHESIESGDSDALCVADVLDLFARDPNRAATAIWLEAMRMGPKLAKAWHLAGLDVDEVIAETTERIWERDGRILRRLDRSVPMPAAVAGVMRNVVREMGHDASSRPIGIDLVEPPADDECGREDFDERPDSRGSSRRIEKPLGGHLTPKQRGVIRSLQATGSFEETAKRLHIAVPSVLARLRRADAHHSDPTASERGLRKIELPAASRAASRDVPDRWKDLYRFVHDGRSRRAIALKLEWTVETTRGELRELRKWLRAHG